MRKGFTLAETLIMMGIMGIVATLTIPSLSTNTTEKQTVTKLQKIYSNLENAFDRATSNYDDVEAWFKDDITKAEISKRFAERMMDSLKYQKYCNTTDKTCFSPQAKLCDKTNFCDTLVLSDGGNFYHKLILADGTSIAMSYPNKYIYADINGMKGPNILGQDIFDFGIEKHDGIWSIVPLGSDNCFDVGEECTKWVIDYENTDYLDVGEDKKCSDGTILEWDVNTRCP